VIDREDITRQVLHNCSISDSRYAGYYSVCGLALRLRDLYKWEKGLDPWVEEDSSAILGWIGEKEEEWDRLAENDFNEIAVSGTRYDPFDVTTINAVLEACGLCYGAGYVHGLKPSFFLANLDEKREIGGHPVYMLGQELARDLLTLPALSQDDRIFIRKESARHFLWNQIFFTRKSGRTALQFALEPYGIREQDQEALRHNFAIIAADELDTYIYHEIGEIQDAVFDRDTWRDMIATFPHTPIELFARAVKDMLADTNGSGKLRYITRERKRSSLGFYVAFIDGLRKELFPEILGAFEEFAETLNWHTMDLVVDLGYSKAKDYAESMIHVFQEGKKMHDMPWAQKEIEKQLPAPLGMMRGQ
jgi:hypothetical protein